MCPQRLLVVDDEADIRMLCIAAISSRLPGLHIDQAADANGALAALAKNTYDVVLTDFRMPGMNGLELIQHACETSAGPRWIVMSAYADQKLAKQSGAIGNVVDFLAKPFGISQLVDSIRTAAARPCGVAE